MKARAHFCLTCALQSLQGCKVGALDMTQEKAGEKEAAGIRRYGMLPSCTGSGKALQEETSGAGLWERSD